MQIIIVPIIKYFSLEKKQKKTHGHYFHLNWLYVALALSVIMMQCFSKMTLNENISHFNFLTSKKNKRKDEM